MRLWHKDFIKTLPRQQLVAQWRELLAIKGAIEKNGTPNHRLVNKVLDYSIEHFITYTQLVVAEIDRRGYRYDKSKFAGVINWEHPAFSRYNPDELYQGWHNKRYLNQNFFNLQEKYDTGIISKEEWRIIVTQGEK